MTASISSLEDMQCSRIIETPPSPLEEACSGVQAASLQGGGRVGGTEGGTDGDVGSLSWLKAAEGLGKSDTHLARASLGNSCRVGENNNYGR